MWVCRPARLVAKHGPVSKAEDSKIYRGRSRSWKRAQGEMTAQAARANGSETRRLARTGRCRVRPTSATAGTSSVISMTVLAAATRSIWPAARRRHARIRGRLASRFGARRRGGSDGVVARADPSLSSRTGPLIADDLGAPPLVGPRPSRPLRQPFSAGIPTAWPGTRSLHQGLAKAGVPSTGLFGTAAAPSAPHLNKPAALTPLDRDQGLP